MASKKLVKCRYTHCKHKDDLRPPDEMVQGGRGTYYHPDCAEERDTINQIVDYYCNNVDDRVTISQLRSVINNIIFKKGVPAKELLFDLKYTHESGRKINSPLTLHYIITNKKVQHEYKKHLESAVTNFDNKEVKVKEETKVTYKPSNSKGFTDIF